MVVGRTCPSFQATRSDHRWKSTPGSVARAVGSSGENSRGGECGGADNSSGKGGADCSCGFVDVVLPHHLCRLGLTVWSDLEALGRLGCLHPT